MHVGMKRIAPEKFMHYNSFVEKLGFLIQTERKCNKIIIKSIHAQNLIK